MNDFLPYGPAAGTDVGDLSIETDPDSVSLFGRITLLKDDRGLRDVRRLIDILRLTERSIEEALSDGEVPDAGIGPPRRGPNPFGSDG